jgi:hypothetical protein
MNGKDSSELVDELYHRRRGKWKKYHPVASVPYTTDKNAREELVEAVIEDGAAILQ